MFVDCDEYLLTDDSVVEEKNGFSIQQALPKGTIARGMGGLLAIQHVYFHPAVAYKSEIASNKAPVKIARGKIATSQNKAIKLASSKSKIWLFVPSDRPLSPMLAKA